MSGSTCWGSWDTLAASDIFLMTSSSHKTSSQPTQFTTDFLSANEEDLLEINDIGPVASNFIKEFLAIEENISLVEDLITLGVNPKPVEIKGDNPFSSKSIVITGSFNSIARSQLKEELIRVGAKVSSSVSSKTEFLIAGEKPGSKLKKASDLQIPILDEEEVLTEEEPLVEDD